MKEKNRFDLEQEILGSWSVTSELQMLIDSIEDTQTDTSIEEVVGIIKGIMVVSELRFERAFSTYEQLLRERKIL